MRSRQRDATRARLLKVARRAFAQHGYDGVPVGELCKKAKVTHGALYHHFPAGKPELFAAVVTEVFAELGGRVSTAVAEHEGWHSVKAACDAYLDACSEAEVQTIIFRDAPRVLASQFESVDHDANEPLVTTLLRDWMAQGLLRPRPVVMLARLLGALFEEAGALIGAATDRIHTRAQVDALLGDWFAALRRAPDELPNTLATDRLVLEPWSTADSATIRRLFAHEELRSLPLLADMQARDWVKEAIRESQRRFAGGSLGMFLARDGQRSTIGAVGLTPYVDRGAHGLRQNNAEPCVLVVVARDHLRKGYGYELAEVVLREANARRISPLLARISESNTAAVQLSQKLGFVRFAQQAGSAVYVKQR